MKALCSLLLAFLFALSAAAQEPPRTVDVPTRPGVTQRLLVLTAPQAQATVILFPGGHGGLQLYPNGSMNWGENNFLVRSRQLFVNQGFNVLVVDAPSDRQAAPYLQGFRQRPEHTADARATIAWARQNLGKPVWLVGTSRGTQSVAYLATELAGADAPDGVVLTSTIVVDAKGRPVPAMPLDKVRVPVLLVHHEQDGCALCPFSGVPQILDELGNAPRKQLVAVNGGQSRGDPCEAMAYHGFNGIEQSVVQQIGSWIKQ